MTALGRILCVFGRHRFAFCAGTGQMECIRPYCFATKTPDEDRAVARLEHAVTAGVGIRQAELQLITGEELRHGDLVAISKVDGKVYRARSGDKIEGAFRIPPTAVIEGDMLNIPREEWKL
jgi:hypothetical protein